MPRLLKLLLWLLSAFLLLCIVVALAVSIAPLNWAKPWVNQQLTELAQRPVQIDGDLRLDWERHDAYGGWRSWVPWPVVYAQDITVANPDWATTGPVMAHADQVRLRLDTLALTQNVVRLADLGIQHGQVVLERRADGTNNWTFGESDPQDSGSAWKVVVDRLMLSDSSLRILDAPRAMDVTLTVDTSQPGEVYGTNWTAQGEYQGVEVSGEGQLGHVLTLQHDTEQFPVQGVLHVGDTTLKAEGTVRRPQNLAALDVQLELSGPTMADLYPILGLALPHTPPYKTAGHLTADLDLKQSTWIYEEFTGTVGDSDLGGTLKYERHEPRPMLTGNLHSELLRFEDLGPLIGAPAPEGADTGSADSEAAPADEEHETEDPQASPDTQDTQEEPDPQPTDGLLTESADQPEDKVLPVKEADRSVWGAMDADVTFEGRRIESNVDLPLDDVQAHVYLNDSVLRLDPLDFGVAGGAIDTTIELDANHEPIRSSLDMEARGLQLSKLFPGVESMEAALGALHGDASMTSAGDSVSTLMANANGNLSAVVSRGTVSHFLLEAAGLNVANMVFVKIFGDEQVTLECVAAEFNINNGLMETQTFILETEDAVVTARGTINLATEEMDLEIRPENKSLRVFTLRSPLYVAGTFKNPDVGVQPAPVAARAGAAVALGVIATPLAALLPLLNLGTEDETSCGSLSGSGSDSDKATIEDTNPDDDKLTGTVEGVAAD